MMRAPLLILSFVAFAMLSAFGVGYFLLWQPIVGS